MTTALKHKRGPRTVQYPAACEYPERRDLVFYCVGRLEAPCPACIVSLIARVVSDPYDMWYRERTGSWITAKDSAREALTFMDPFDPLTVVLSRTLEAL